MSFLRGPDRTQTQLLPPSIEEYVPEDALVRVIEAFVETLDLEALGFARARPNSTGRPGYDPADMLGLYIYGYVNRIRSSRRLECEAHRNLEVIWLMRNLRPDFKTISEFRRRNTGACRGVLREFNLLCRRMDLFAAELVAIDGSKFKASNNFRKSYDEKQLRSLLEKIDAGIATYLATLEESDRESEGGFGRTVGQSSSEESQELERQAFREKLAGLKKGKKECEMLLDSLLSSNESASDESPADESPQTKSLMEEAQPRKDISRTDRDSRRLKNSKGPGTLVGYNTQVAVDSKHGLILIAEVVPEANDLNQLSPMTQAVQEFLDLESPRGKPEAGPLGTESDPKPLTVLADSGYCEAAHLEDCERRGVIPIVPRPRTTMGRSNNGEKIYAKDAFHYDAARDVYVCPAQQEMTLGRERNRRGKVYFDYTTRACTGCPLKACCTKSHYRTITRRAEEGAVERSRERVKAQPHMMRVRQGLVEKVFGTMRMWGHDQFLLRGLPKVRGEFTLSALAYNLRRCVNILGVPAIMRQLTTC